MGRKKKCRTIDLDMWSICYSFGPLSYSEEEREKMPCLLMEADELQTLKLKDGEWLTMVEWAERMWISKSVFGEIYKKARRKLVDMVVNTKTLMIRCPYESDDDTYRIE